MVFEENTVKTIGLKPQTIVVKAGDNIKNAIANVIPSKVVPVGKIATLTLIISGKIEDT